MDLRSLVTYPLEPIKAAAFCIIASQVDLPSNYDEVSKDVVEESKQKYQDKLVPKDVEEKVTQFLKSKNVLNTKKIIIVEGNEEPASSDRTSDYVATLKLHKNTISEISNNFTDEHKFVIGHEAGHIVKGDIYDVSTRMLANLASLFAFTFYYTTVDVKSPVLSYLLSCFFALLIKTFALGILSKEKEYLADNFAATLSPKIAKGGISSLKKAKKGLDNVVKSPYPNFISDDKWENVKLLPSKYPSPQQRIENIKSVYPKTVGYHQRRISSRSK